MAMRLLCELDERALRAYEEVTDDVRRTMTYQRGSRMSVWIPSRVMYLQSQVNMQQQQRTLESRLGLNRRPGARAHRVAKARPSPRTVSLRFSATS